MLTYFMRNILGPAVAVLGESDIDTDEEHEMFCDLAEYVIRKSSIYNLSGMKFEKASCCGLIINVILAWNSNENPLLGYIEEFPILQSSHKLAAFLRGDSTLPNNSLIHCVDTDKRSLKA